MTQKMQFAEFIWPQNPASLSVSHARQMQAYAVPYGGELLQDMGKRNIVITGEGVLKGCRAAAQFAELKALQDSAAVDMLCISGLPPIMARLTELELVGKFNPDKIGYRFTFQEDRSVPLPAMKTQRRTIHTAAEGENLWAIANQYHTSVEILRRENPQIQWPGYLPAGTQVTV